MLNTIKYIDKSKFKKFEKLKFNSTQEPITLNTFKSYYIHDFYTRKQLSALKKLLGIGHVLLNVALTKRRFLDKLVTRKYYALLSLKQIPNRFSKFRRRYLKKKKQKKNVNLRVKKFFRINYDNFLFYLTVSNKQLIIKPFNFLNSLFFYKTRLFKKLYSLRKRKRINYKFVFRKRRRRRRRYFWRKKIRYLRYKFKKKHLFKRLRKLKIRRFRNFLRFIAFFNACKKIKINIDDNFRIKSIFYKI